MCVVSHGGFPNPSRTQRTSVPGHSVPRDHSISIGIAWVLSRISKPQTVQAQGLGHLHPELCKFWGQSQAPKTPLSKGNFFIVAFLFLAFISTSPEGDSRAQLVPHSPLLLNVWSSLWNCLGWKRDHQVQPFPQHSQGLP